MPDIVDITDVVFVNPNPDVDVEAADVHFCRVPINLTVSCSKIRKNTWDV